MTGSAFSATDAILAGVSGTWMWRERSGLTSHPHARQERKEAEEASKRVCTAAAAANDDDDDMWETGHIVYIHVTATATTLLLFGSH